MRDSKIMPQSLRQGIEHEQVAEAYLRGKGIPNQTSQIFHSGLIINPKWPWLGCSPDGIIMEKDIPVGCIQVKCPYSEKENTLEDAARNSNFFLKLVNNELMLKENHNCYFQCQGV